MQDNILDLSNLNAERPKVKLPGGEEVEMLNALDLGPAKGKRIQRLLARVRNLEEEMETAIESDFDEHIEALEFEQLTAMRGMARLICPEIDEATAVKLPLAALAGIMSHFLATTGQVMADVQGIPITVPSSPLSNDSTAPPTP